MPFAHFQLSLQLKVSKNLKDMETIINDFVSEHLAAFVVCVIIALAVFAVALWFVFSYVQFKRAARCEEHTRRIEEMGKATCNLPCNAHGDKIERHSVSVGKIETTLAFLAKSMDEISSQLRQMNGASQLTRQNSPLAITERGWEAVRRLGIDTMFAGNWPRIRRLIDSEVECKNAYDINDYCIKHAVVYPEKFLRH